MDEYPNLTALVDDRPGLREWIEDNPHPLHGEVFMGHTETELRTAFALVKNPENWKMPVDTVLPAHLTEVEQALISDAVGFYCGGGAFVRLSPGGTRVTYPGYYAVIGA